MIIIYPGKSNQPELQVSHFGWLAAAKVQQPELVTAFGLSWLIFLLFLTPGNKGN